MRYVVLSVLSLMLAVTLLAPRASAADKIERVTGTVRRISKDTSTIEIAAGSAPRHTVIYNSDTKFTKRKAPGSIDDMKEGRRVICLGKFDDKARLVASQIDVRTE